LTLVDHNTKQMPVQSFALMPECLNVTVHNNRS